MKIEPFEKFFLRYERWFDANFYIYQSELLAIKMLLPKVGKSIEIGVGSGRFAAPLGIDIGLEPSEQMIKLALSKGIDVIKAIGEKLPLKNEIFDLVLMVTTICFLNDVETAFENIYDILKSNGIFIIGFIDRKSPIGKLYQAHKEQNVFYRVAKFYSVEEVLQYLRKARFSNFEFSQTIFHQLSEIKALEPVRPGYGKGSFVIIKAEKN
ncbi:MAG: class I SAM-dependent methyltransferase [Promethearchaeota archaeon]